MSLPLVPPLGGGIPLAGVAGKPPKDDPAAIADAAKKFEALLLAQMLKSAREAGDGPFGEKSDQTTASLNEVAEQQFAELLALSGGLGLARLVTQQLTDARAAASNSGEKTR